MEEKEKQLHWYALKVFYNKVFEMEDLLEAYRIESYIPVSLEQQKGRAHSFAAKKLAGEKDRIARRKFIQEGPIIYRRTPLIASLMFIHADSDQLALVAERLYDRDLQKAHGFIYKGADKKKPKAIPDIQMDSFRLAISAWNHGWDILEADVPVSKGDKVRVTEGPLKGAEGHVKRIGKDKRLLICIEGVIAVATSYIPRKFLEKVEE